MDDPMKRLKQLEHDVESLFRRVDALERKPPPWPGAITCPLCEITFQGEHVGMGCGQPECPVKPKHETGERPLDEKIQEQIADAS